MQTQGCPSWPKEHDWKSCNASTSIRGFESLALRQIKKEHLHGVLFFISGKGFGPMRYDCASSSSEAELSYKKHLVFYTFSNFTHKNAPLAKKQEELNSTKVFNYISER